MNGSYVHELIVQELDQAFRKIGAKTETQVWAGTKTERGFIDLVAWIGEQTIAVEAEKSAQRIDRDLRKAAILEATELWIVVPNRRVFRQVQARLDALKPLSIAFCFVLTLGQAMSRVTTLKS